ncbi:MAG: hypothetical protein GY913_29190 [Proteobacteria bacterium]|nr:hypothetical protein [Pseudomonadota bacterium]MCP4920990.1 hypothetical protein [Pseudomonadota bacterium]
MPFSPLRLLVAYDDADGLCGAVVPRMVELLNARAFTVETVVIDDAPRDHELWEYAGLVLGTPSYGLGLRGAGPSERVVKWVEAQGGLDDVKVAVFSAFQGRAGNSLRNVRQLVVDNGGECIARHPYWLKRPAHDEHVLPAECMVRIR